MNLYKIGNYKLLEKIKPNSSSSTYKAEHIFTKKLHALKLIIAKDSDLILQLKFAFENLSQGILKLSHPSIINFKEYFIERIEDYQCFVIVSDFFEGDQLDSYLKNNQEQLSPNQLIQIYLKICKAIQAAHSCNYIDVYGYEIGGFPHCDIRPWNILINEKEDIKITDFKITNVERLFQFEEDMPNSVVKAISLVQKYQDGLAPEQIEKNIANKRTDIYQLGQLFYFMFKRDFIPYKEGAKVHNYAYIFSNLSGIKQRHKYANIISKATEWKPENRFTSIQEIIDAVNKRKIPLPFKGDLSRRNKGIGKIIGYAVFIIFSYLTLLNYQNIDRLFHKGEDVVTFDNRGVIVGSAVKKQQIPLDQGVYHALLIGNENYSIHSQLKRPIQDVNKMSELLIRHFGFSEEHIIKLENADRDDIYDGLELLGQKTDKFDKALIFYAGHGKIDDREGYWIPIDGNLESRRNWIANTEIKSILKNLPALNILVISDACFSGSILRNRSPNPSPTISNYNKKTRVAMTSGSLESVPDHSVFIDELFLVLENKPDSILYAHTIFSEIYEAVKTNTDNNPAYGLIQNSGHQAGDFYFLRKSISK